ncbi:bleomycin resistance protein [Cohnella algarum]|uniref:bleomycin resistance protein n=1 Tax=Cohnella algarum TaxID=2044859 RepID=UPI0019673C33|nr:VOC family protein [Cohnella algarum]MBN2984682.1 VOC family protein [Cohnella algarum]
MAESRPPPFAIPILPCRSIDEQLDFYRALGFEITYRQTRPNAYACVSCRGIVLHFFTIKGFNPSESYGMCYIRVPDVDDVYREMAGNLKKTYGKLLSKGIPRITKLNTLAADRRFNLVDPGGNHLMIGQTLEVPDASPSSGLQSEPDSQLARAFETAYSLAYAKLDAAASAKVLDAALAKAEPAASAALRFKALVLRADAAVSMDDYTLAGKLLSKARQLALGDEERQAAAEALERAKELEQTISG